MIEIRSAVRHAHHTLSRDELVTKPVTVLLGVSDDAANVLKDLGVRTIFDLGISQVFNSARQLSELIGSTEGVMARHQMIPGDVLDAGIHFDSLAQIAGASPKVLRHIGESTAAKLAGHLGITTLHELGHWQPFLAAHALVHESIAAETTFIDPGIPTELVPKFNQYPTEKFFYSVYAIDGSRASAGLVELAGGFIPQDERGIVNQGPGYGRALTFATG